MSDTKVANIKIHNEPAIVRVRIDNEQIDLVSDDDKGHILRVAEYVNEKISMIRAGRKVVPTSPSLMKLLIALNIADDYFKQLNENDILNKKLDASDEEIIRLLEDNDILNKRVRKLDKEIRELRGENESYCKRLEEFETEMSGLQEDNDRLSKRLKEFEHEMGGLQEEKFMLMQKFDELRLELVKSKQELVDYVENFGK